MPLEVATYINQLNTANPVGSDPLAQADDHLRLLKTTIKNTFPNIDGAVTVTDDVLNALPGRVTALEEGGVGGGGTGLISLVTTLPATGSYVGETVFNEADGIIYTWDGTAWVPLTLSTNYTPDVPPAVGIVTSLPATATDGDVVFNTNDNKLYERVNGAWVEVVITVNAAQEVADASITVAKFAQGIRPIEIVNSLPTTGNSEGRMVYLTTDDKIYRFTGAAFTSSMPFGDLTGTIAANQIAANTVTAGMIQAGAIGADQIAAGAISTAKLAAGAITAEKIAATTITADKIATNAITSDKISANAITAGKIAAAAIGTTQLSAGAVTSTKVAAGAITAGAIAAGAITAGSGIIADAAVGTLQIAGNSVTVPVKFSFGPTALTGSTYSGSFTLPAAANVLILVNVTLPNNQGFYLNDAGTAYYSGSPADSRYFPISLSTTISISIDGTSVFTETPNHGFGTLTSVTASRFLSTGGNKTFTVSFTPSRFDGVSSYSFSDMCPRNIEVFVLGAVR